MATGVILTVLSNIPWGQVIDNAPKVAEGATRLWNSVGSLRKKAPPAAPEPAAAATPAKVPPTQAEVLRAQVQILEADVRNLTEQMQASSELIKALAEQNAQLVQRIEMNRVRLRQLVIAASATAAGLVAALGYLLMRG
ncbi:MAG: hypothetical protein EOO29_06370 [Comamonadaceae bacterium]|nr:MAG: hypothetical protein EOO29_06370 [Comamonadaceae bacterium]